MGTNASCRDVISELTGAELEGEIAGTDLEGEEEEKEEERVEPREPKRSEFSSSDIIKSLKLILNYYIRIKKTWK